MLLTLAPGAIGGSETYVRNLARLLPTFRDVKTICYLPRESPELRTAAEIRALPDMGVTQGARRAASMIRTQVRGNRTRRTIEREPIDVIHFPLTTPVPRASNHPTVVTLHDLQHRALPLHFSRRERAFRRWFYDHAAVSADHVIVISDFVRRHVEDELGVDRSRISVIPLGIDHGRFYPDSGPRESFILYPAANWAHKNHARLIQAMERVRREEPTLRLVLTGLRNRSDRWPEWVDARGRIDDEDLARLYRRAAGMVFPSLYEGFGLPPLEAMASGCPVAASNAASLPEICGTAAHLFNPECVESIADGIRAVLNADASVVEKGLQHAANFTWERCAARHAEVYRQMAGGALA